HDINKALAQLYCALVKADCLIEIFLVCIVLGQSHTTAFRFAVAHIETLGEDARGLFFFPRIIKPRRIVAKGKFGTGVQFHSSRKERFVAVPKTILSHSQNNQTDHGKSEQSDYCRTQSSCRSFLFEQPHDGSCDGGAESERSQKCVPILKHQIVGESA